MPNDHLRPKCMPFEVHEPSRLACEEQMNGSSASATSQSAMPTAVKTFELLAFLYGHNANACCAALGSGMVFAHFG
jgi:hypothetical protein